jgi:large subunit ribosomal protein L25
LEFVGDPRGVTLGGTLLKPVNELEIRGPAGNLPSTLQADISNLGVGESLHVSDLVAPEGIEILASCDAEAPRAAM